MKFKVTIEEFISQDFMIEADTLEKAKKIAAEDYNNGFISVDDGQLTYKQMMASNEDGTECTEWTEF